MTSCMISCGLWYHRSCHIMYHDIRSDIMIMHDIIYHIWYYTGYHDIYFLCLAAANPPPAQRADAADDDREPDRTMYFIELKNLIQRVQRIGVLDTPPLTHSGTRATAVSSTRWLSGCGARPGPPAAAPGWCLSPRLRGPAPKGSMRAGSGRQRRGSVAARQRLQQRGRPKAAFKLERIEYCPMILCIISYFISYVWYHG